MKFFLAFFLFILCIIGSAKNLESVEQERQKKLIKKVNELKNNPQKIIGIELIIAGGNSDQLMSRFGHSFIRLVDDDKDWTNDIVISFAMNTDQIKDFKYFNTLTGEYPLTLYVENFGSLRYRYAYEERREVARQVILSDKRLRTNLINVLHDWSLHPEEVGDYTFLSNNCAGGLIHLLRAAGFPHNNKKIIMPTSLDTYFHRSNLSPLYAFDTYSYEDLEEELKETFKNEKPTLAGLRRVYGNKAQVMAIRIIVFKYPVDLTERRKLQKAFRYKLNSAVVEEALKLVRLDARLYQFCETLECAKKHVSLSKKVLETESTFWLRNKLSLYKPRRSSNRENSFDEMINKQEEKIVWNGYEETIKLHYDLLKEAIYN